MGFFGLRYREEMDEAVAREFDGLNETLRSMFFAEHDEQGRHNFNPDGRLNSTIQQIIDGYQSSGQWWKQGPWILNTPESGDELANRAILRPPDPAAGTYHDYDAPGLDTAVGLSIEPTGDITITGIKNGDISKERLFFFRNRDSSATITLAHEDTGSLEAYRFDLPNDEDVEVGPRQNVWLFYDSDRERWTFTVTGTATGGFGAADTSSSGGGNVSFGVAEFTLSELEIESLNTSPKVIVPAAGAGTMLLPLECALKVTTTTAYTSNPSFSIRFQNRNIDLSVLNAFALSSASVPITVVGKLMPQNWSPESPATFDPRNKALVIALSSNPTGAGSATGSGSISYAIHTGL